MTGGEYRRPLTVYGSLDGYHGNPGTVTRRDFLVFSPGAAQRVPPMHGRRQWHYRQAAGGGFRRFERLPARCRQCHG